MLNTSSSAAISTTTLQLCLGVLVCLGCLFPPTEKLLAQSFTEEPMPHPLPGALYADLFEGASGSLHLVGIGDSLIGRMFDDSWGVHMPFAVERDADGSWILITLPDTGAYYYGPFYWSTYNFLAHAAVGTDDTLTIVWSRQQFEGTDVPPPIEYEPRIRCVRRTHSDVQTIFDIPSGKNPRVTTGQDGSTHWVWEQITPVPPDTNYLTYTSTVSYRFQVKGAEVGDTQEIDAGFAPQVLTDIDDNVHLVWLKASNSASRHFRLRYCRGRDGVFSSPITLHDSIMTPLQDIYSPQRPAIAFSVDDFSNVYTGWSEPRTTYPEYRFFLLKWNGLSTTVDSSQLYPSYTAQFAFRNNGEVHSIWGFGPLEYSSNVNGPLFSQTRIFQSTENGGGPFIQLSPDGTPKAIFTDWSRVSINYIMDLADGPDTYFEGPTMASIERNPFALTQPVLTDSENQTWVVFRRGTYGSYSWWLARFVDSPNSTTGPDELTGAFELHQNFPNPFNPSTTITFEMKEPGLARLGVFDILGREIAILVNEPLARGGHRIDWDGSDFPSGIYYYRLTTVDFSQTRQMVLIK